MQFEYQPVKSLSRSSSFKTESCPSSWIFQLPLFLDEYEPFFSTNRISTPSSRLHLSDSTFPQNTFSNPPGRIRKVWRICQNNIPWFLTSKSDDPLTVDTLHEIVESLGTGELPHHLEDERSHSVYLELVTSNAPYLIKKKWTVTYLKKNNTQRRKVTLQLLANSESSDI